VVGRLVTGGRHGAPAVRPAALVLLALLAGCAGQDRVVQVPCRPGALATYSAAEQLAMADALDQVGDASPLRRAMEDYGVLRAELRALHACW
jgi:hypothetical protein